MEHLANARQISGQEVFEKWFQSEEAIWGQLARELGYQGVPEFRRATIIDLLGLQNQEKWDIYKIQNPKEFLASCHIGPYPRWHDFFSDTSVPEGERTFGKLVDVAEDKLLKHNRIPAIMRNFPSPTQLVGMNFSDNPNEEGYVYMVDGSHRAAARVLGAKLEPIS